MKNKFGISAACLFISALLLNFSFDSNGNVEFFTKANASSHLWKSVAVQCDYPYENQTGVGCDNGSDSTCIPINCPGH